MFMVTTIRFLINKKNGKRRELSLWKTIRKHLSGGALLVGGLRPMHPFRSGLGSNIRTLFKTIKFNILKKSEIFERK